VEFVGGSVEQAIRGRCEQIGVKYEELVNGEVWVDNHSNTKVLHCSPRGRVGNPPQARSLPHNYKDTWTVPVLPPLADLRRLV
jgi:hypothetical protein